ncbi:hypothetical protein [Kitasatospora cineracea]|uniref:hypothetical protein n=1 Tax=Kitasatospora cineracea TaxID=88074 RepID=UPI00369CD251
MRAIKRVAAIAASTAVLVGGMVFAGTSAQAATSCTSTGNGSLCLNSYGSVGFQISYQKNSGSTAHVDFHLVCSDGTWYGDDGDFYASVRAQAWTYIFAVGTNHGVCAGQLIDLTTGTTWQTNHISTP